jgi:hypothetical protein
MDDLKIHVCAGRSWPLLIWKHLLWLIFTEAEQCANCFAIHCWRFLALRHRIWNPSSTTFYVVLCLCWTLRLCPITEWIIGCSTVIGDKCKLLHLSVEIHQRWNNTRKKDWANSDGQTSTTGDKSSNDLHEKHLISVRDLHFFSACVDLEISDVDIGTSISSFKANFLFILTHVIIL